MAVAGHMKCVVVASAQQVSQSIELETKVQLQFCVTPVATPSTITILGARYAGLMSVALPSLGTEKTTGVHMRTNSVANVDRK